MLKDKINIFVDYGRTSVPFDCISNLIGYPSWIQHNWNDFPSNWGPISNFRHWLKSEIHAGTQPNRPGKWDPRTQCMLSSVTFPPLFMPGRKMASPKSDLHASFIEQVRRARQWGAMLWFRSCAASFLPSSEILKSCEKQKQIFKGNCFATGPELGIIADVTKWKILAFVFPLHLCSRGSSHSALRSSLQYSIPFPDFWMLKLLLMAELIEVRISMVLKSECWRKTKFSFSGYRKAWVTLCLSFFSI